MTDESNKKVGPVLTDTQQKIITEQYVIHISKTVNDAERISFQKFIDEGISNLGQISEEEFIEERNYLINKWFEKRPRALRLRCINPSRDYNFVRNTDNEWVINDKLEKLFNEKYQFLIRMNTNGDYYTPEQTHNNLLTFANEHYDLLEDKL